HRHGRARETDRDRARGQTAGVELGAQRSARVFRVDGEGLHPVTLDRRDAEPVTDHHHGEPEQREFRKRELHQRRRTPLTDRTESVNGPPTTPERPPKAGRRRYASERWR